MVASVQSGNWDRAHSFRFVLVLMLQGLLVRGRYTPNIHLSRQLSGFIHFLEQLSGGRPKWECKQLVGWLGCLLNLADSSIVSCQHELSTLTPPEL